MPTHTDETLPLALILTQPLTCCVPNRTQVAKTHTHAPHQAPPSAASLALAPAHGPEQLPGQVVPQRAHLEVGAYLLFPLAYTFH